MGMLEIFRKLFDKFLGFDAVFGRKDNGKP